MKTSDIPFLKEKTMATEPTKVEKAPDKPALGLSGGRAAESGHPQVQWLLAEFETARLNDDKNRQQELSKQLKELGYE